MNTQLIHFDAAKRELALASSIDEVKLLRDKAEALRQYIKQQGASLEMQNQCAEIKIRAERKAGELLGKQVSAGNPQLLHDVIIAPKLSELGITPMQSHRWQLEATVPDEEFEQFVTEIKSEGGELTSSGFRRFASKLRIAEIDYPPLPEGLFNVIVIDPPWPYETVYNDETRRVGSSYPEKGLDELGALKIPYANDCILWLWATNAFIHDAFHLLEVWEFEPKALLTWFKGEDPEHIRTGVGYWLRGQTEHCILSTRNNPQVTHSAQGTALFGKATKHSDKPDEFYKLVESLCPGRKLDMFARKQREGWTVWGNEVNLS